MRARDGSRCMVAANLPRPRQRFQLKLWR
jgi:hypothetical protein